MGTLLYFAGALINLGFFVYLLVIVFQTDHLSLIHISEPTRPY